MQNAHHEFEDVIETPGEVAEAGSTMNVEREESSNYKQIKRRSPLYFRCKIGGKYYVSFIRRQLWLIVAKCVLLFVFNYFIVSFFAGLASLNQYFVEFIKYALLAQAILHALLCFVDPGTLFEDEEDNFKQERIFCTTCELYRRRSSRHCALCNRCVRKYDHHCGVFGKCIGGGNIVIFYLMLTITSFEGPTLMISLVYHLISQATGSTE